MKKKLVSTMLGLTLVLSMTTAAFADTTVGPDSNGDPDPSTAAMTVTYEVDPAYTVTIPADVTIGNTATVSAEDVTIAEGTAVEVSITATSEDGEFLIRSNGGTGEETLEYTVTDSDSTEYALNDTVLSVSPDDGAGSVDLTFALADGVTPTYSGTYSGTVTFTIAIN